MMMMMCSALTPYPPQLPPDYGSPFTPSSRSLSSLRNGGLGFSFAQAIAGGGLRFVPSSPWIATTVGRQSLHLRASFAGFPVLWIVRTLVFYAFVQTGLAARSLSFSQDGESRGTWISRSIVDLLNKDNEADRDRHRIKVRNRWQTTLKGTLKRRYRVPTKAEGRRLLSAISSLLSDDDSFRDAASHKVLSSLWSLPSAVFGLYLITIYAGMPDSTRKCPCGKCVLSQC
eukprot:c21810_g1_i2 orf=88-774(+)